MPEKVDEDNKINVVGMLMSIKTELSSLNAKVDDLQDVDSKAEHANDRANYAVNVAKENTKAIKELQKKQSKNDDNHTQYWVAIVGATVPILVDIILRALHVFV